MPPIISRGFRGRRDDAPSDRVPPGQYVTRDFPVLSAGPTPHTPLDAVGLLDRRRGGRAAPLDVGGVPGAAERRGHRRHPLRDQVVEARHRLARASRSTRCSTASRPPAEYVVQFCDGGYTTNLPLEDVTGGKAWVAFAYDGEPLEPEHGGPARMLVPHLYFWKSAKWVRGLRLLGDGRARLLGVERLPQLRRPVAGAAVLGRLTWQRRGGRRRRRRDARVPRRSPSTCPAGPDIGPGQHVDVRLTAEDGYQAQRSYSIASAPDGTRVELTVERLDDGEVSPYLTDELRPGDRIELRGPVGGYFVWEPAQGGPLLLVAGGSGVVPLMAMIRARAAAGSDVDTRLLFSSRSWDDVIYREELERLDGDGLTVVHTLTRSQPPGWTGYARRVDAEMLAEVGPSPAELPRVYVCGPTPFVEAAAEALVQLGHEPHRVKTERFGPTGG